MFSKFQVKSLANEAYKEFSKKHKIACQISLISLDEFWKLAKKSLLIRDDMKRKIPLKVGALVVHGEKDVICLNEDIISNITNDSNFVKAVVFHELYHVLLKNQVKKINLDEEVKSENRVDFLLEKEFPKYARYFV
jgi:hypothetical protein